MDAGRAAASRLAQTACAAISPALWPRTAAGLTQVLTWSVVGGAGKVRAEVDEEVGEHVTQGRAHVEARVLGSHEDRGGDRIDDEPDGGDREHPASEDVRRVPEAADCLPDDPAGDQDEREAVHERGEDLGPLEAEAPARRRRSRGERQRNEREPDREGVGEHVPRVREKRE